MYDDRPVYTRRQPPLQRDGRQTRKRAIPHEASDTAEIGRAFVRARRTAQPLSDYPGGEPADMATAYAIQDAAIAERRGVIAGWKVGRIQPPHEQRFGANRLAGPIFADQLVVAAGDPPVMRVFAGGFGAVEAEFLLRLGPIDPARRHYDLVAALDIVVAVHVGIEIASSPFPRINQCGPAITASDFGNNNGLIVGPAIPDWRTRGIEDWRIATEIDGVEAGAGRAATFPDGLAGAVRFLLELLAGRGRPPTEGCWISSGAVSGVHPIAPGQHAMARFGAHFELGCAIAAAEPTN